MISEARGVVKRARHEKRIPAAWKKSAGAWKGSFSSGEEVFSRESGRLLRRARVRRGDVFVAISRALHANFITLQHRFCA